MNKKTFITLALASATILTAQAQKSASMTAFKHVGIGVEAGLMGAGVQISYPVVTDHLVLSVGYNFGAFGQDLYSQDFTIDKGKANQGVNRLNEEIERHNRKVGVTPLDKVDLFDSDVEISAGLQMCNFGKVLLEYYPIATTNFHITAGVMFGDKSMFTIQGTADDRVQHLYNRAMEAQEQLKREGEIAASDDFVTEKMSFNVDKHTYAINQYDPTATDNVKAELNIEGAKIRPYLGLGWGRSIPMKRVGFQFEIGAWYHGKMEISSPNEVKYNKDVETNKTVDDLMKTVKSLAIYPQMTFRLTGRLF